MYLYGSPKMLSVENEFKPKQPRLPVAPNESLPMIEVSDYSSTVGAGDEQPASSNASLKPSTRNVRSTSFQLEPSYQIQLTKQLSNFETKRRLSTVSSAPGDGAWVQAAQNLQNALSVAPTPTQRKNSLQILLKEVEKNENVTAQELIEKLKTAPKEADQRRSSLGDWSTLKIFRKINKPEHLLSVCVEESASKPPSEAGSERSSLTDEAVDDFEKLDSNQAPPLRLFRANAVKLPKRKSTESAQSHEHGHDEGDVFDSVTFDLPERTIQEIIEEEPQVTVDEDEISQLLVDVAEGFASSGQSFENLIQVLQHQKIQDNLNSAVDYALQKLQEQWSNILDILVPMEKIQTMLFVCLIQTVSFQHALKAMPILACYISFWVMIYSSLKLFHANYWAKEAEKWRRLFRIFTIPVPTGDMESHDSSASLVEQDKAVSMASPRITRPYVHYFTALAVFVFSTSMSGGNIPNALSLSALSLVFAVLSCLTLNDHSKHWSHASILLTVVALLPSLFSKLSTQTDVVLPVLDKRLLELSVGTFRLGCSAPGFSAALATCIHLVLLYRWISNKKVASFEETILPHVVCLTWWRISVELLLIGQDSIEWANLALTAGMLWVVFSPTGAALGIVAILIAIQLTSWISLFTLLKIALTLSILFLPFFYSKIRQYLADHAWFPALLSGTSGQPRTSAFIVYAILVFGSVVFLYQGNLHASHSRIDLSWTTFENRCGETYMDELKNQGMDGQFLDAQIHCNELRGAIVQWEGHVKSVEIASIENFFGTLFSYLPHGLAQRLRCFYGDQPENSTLRRCSLSSSNVYTFTVDVVCERNEIGDSKIRLVASHGFTDMVIDLRKGDLVRFTASFSDDVGLKYPTRMILHRLKCLGCQKEESNSTMTDSLYGGEEGIWGKLYEAMCAIFNFVFAPLIIAE